MYQIKQLPEDFVVKEISKINFLDRGSYACFKLIKKNWNTLSAVKKISMRLNVPMKNIGFAGNKDKKAMTEQVISIKEVSKTRVESLKVKDISLEFLGFLNEPITLGKLEGNYFEIVVRRLDSFEIKDVDKIINYFGEQRFGENNAEVGRALIKKDFAQACSLLELEVVKNDYVGAIKKIPKRLLRLYVNAYQSFIWNETVKGVIEKRVEEFPLVGFGTDLNDFPEVKEFLDKEGVSLNDFIIKQIPELSLEGEMRKVFVPIKDFKVLGQEDDELNPGKKKVRVSFELEKGSYATVVIKEIFS